MYLSIYTQGARYLDSLSSRNHLIVPTGSESINSDIVIHLFIDEIWHLPRGSSLLQIGNISVRSITLILHPAETLQQPVFPFDTPDCLEQLFCPSSFPKDSEYIIVGLEAVPLPMLGLPTSLSLTEVENRVRGMRDYGPRIKFVLMSYWSRAQDPLDVEVPDYMFTEAVRASSWYPIQITCAS